MAFVLSQHPTLFLSRPCASKPAGLTRKRRTFPQALCSPVEKEEDEYSVNNRPAAYLRSIQNELNKPIAPSPMGLESIVPKRANKELDIWDSLIDDATDEDQFCSGSEKQYDVTFPHSTAKSAKSKAEPKPAKAREVAGKPAKANKRVKKEQGTSNAVEASRKSSKQVHSSQPVSPVKKKRGRPKGSKKRPTMNARESSRVQGDSKSSSRQTSPSDSAQAEDFQALGKRLREEWRRRVQEASEFEVPIPATEPNRSNVTLHAPNGCPEDGGEDLIQELLPLLARMELEAKRKPSEREKEIREQLQIEFDENTSMHRQSNRLENLKPFKKRKESQILCEQCNGEGSLTCRYCKGEGFLDLGPEGRDFQRNYMGKVFSELPKHVMGTYYYCPVCDGTLKEKCDKCDGKGDITTDDDLKPGASRTPRKNKATKVFDMEEFIAENADRIDIGLDGLVFLRAKPREGRTPSPSRVGKRKRGRPRKQSPTDLDDDEDAVTFNVRSVDRSTAEAQEEFMRSAGGETLSPSKGSPGITRPSSRTTDFVNTTDYQVGRKLRRQSSGMKDAGKAQVDDASADAESKQAMEDAKDQPQEGE